MPRNELFIGNLGRDVSQRDIKSVFDNQNLKYKLIRECLPESQILIIKFNDIYY